VAKTAACPATLIVGPSWVGDMVMAQSLFNLLKQREPERPIDVLAPGWSLPVVARMPEVRNGIDAETQHKELGIRKRRKIGQSLRGKYDRAIVMPRSIKAALVPWFARVETRVGFRGEMRYGLLTDIRQLDRSILDQTVKRFLALGTAPDEALPEAPYPALRVSPENQETVMQSLGLRSERPVVAMMPGAEYGPAKCWPFEHFAGLARLLVADGMDVWILGSQKDNVAGVAIAEQSPAINLCGKTSLEDVIDLLGFATHAVSNDSGLMHIAAAVGANTHAIYGSSSPLFTPPLTATRKIHYLDIECSPCFERECPLGHLRCLKEIDAKSVRAGILAA
jgi:heptosyltransferase-2